MDHQPGGFGQIEAAGELLLPGALSLEYKQCS